MDGVTYTLTGERLNMETKILPDINHLSANHLFSSLRAKSSRAWGSACLGNLSRTLLRAAFEVQVCSSPLFSILPAQPNAFISVLSQMFALEHLLLGS